MEISVGSSNRQGQAILQYVVIAMIIVGLAVAMAPMFQETNEMITSAGPQGNPMAVNKEGVIDTTLLPNLPPAGPTTTADIPVDPPAPPGPPPSPPPVGGCGPFGCGNIDIPVEESVCGTIPGPAGVLNDGCWLCNHNTQFWEWSDDVIKCQNYWWDITTTCLGMCSYYNPPMLGYNLALGYCYICNQSSSLWEVRGYADGMGTCTDYWESGLCINTDLDHAGACGTCLGGAPVKAIYNDPVTQNDMCWICSSADGWINTTDIDNACVPFWHDDICPAYTTVDTDFPNCGCVASPPARGPNSLAPGCWICDQGSWEKEYDTTKCNNFWVNKICPGAPGVIPLDCGDPLPTTSPAINECWLCSNPSENYRLNIIDPLNELYSDWGQPCDSFWVNEEYPPYLTVPTGDQDTACSNPLPLLPGIYYDSSSENWGCQLCSNIAQNYSWVYWYGDKFDGLGTPQYQACHDFWMEGNYPTSIPGAPASPSSSEWIWQYGGGSADYAHHVVSSSLYSYVVGLEASIGAFGGGDDLVIIKVSNSDGSVVWKRQYGAGNVEEGFRVAFDGSSLYVVGQENTTVGNKELFVMEISSFNGDVIWGKRFGGANFEFGKSIAVSDNHIYVYGSENSDPTLGGSNKDLLVIKINKANDYIAWSRQYNLSSGTGDFSPGNISVDSFGNFYITAFDATSSKDYVMKINPTGAVVWAKSFSIGGVAGFSDIVKSFGTLYYVATESITGSIGGGYDIIVASLNESNGNINWAKEFGGLGDEFGAGVTFDGLHVFAVGSEDSDSLGGNEDVVVLKVNHSDGSNEWVKQYGGNLSEIAESINYYGKLLYISGREQSDPDGGGDDLLVMSISKNQTTNVPEWTSFGNDYNITSADATISDEPFDPGVASGALSWGADNIAGAWGGWVEEPVEWPWDAGLGSTSDSEWVYEYGGSGDDEATAVTYYNGYVYVAGQERSDSAGGNYDVFLMKMNEADGTVVWKNQYGGSSVENANYILYDEGYIYLCGEESSDPNGGARDDLLMKINSSDGSVVWKLQYGGSANEDTAEHIAINESYIYLTGDEMTDSEGGNRDVIVMKINKSDGSVVWKHQYGYVANGSGESIDAEGSYLYVTGQDDYDTFVMKLNASDGIVVWKKRYGGNSSDHTKAYDVEFSGSYLYVAGTEASDPAGGGLDVYAMKLNESDGSVIWKKQYGGSGKEVGEELSLSGNYLYIGGYETSDSSGGAEDAFLMKIDEADGSVVWKNQYGGPGTERIDCVEVVDSHIFAVGRESSDPDGGGFDALVMKLSIDQPSSNITEWSQNGTDINWLHNGVNITNWTLEGTSLNYEVINEWNLEGTILDDEIIDQWNVEGAISSWNLEGTTIDDEIWDFYVIDPAVSITKSEWAYEYGGSGNDTAYDIAYLKGFAYVVGQESSDSDGGSADIFVMKVSEADGTVVWKNQYGGNFYDEAFGVYASGNSLYVTGIESSDPDGGDNDIFVMKLNQINGTVVWKNQYGGSGSDRADEIKEIGSYLYVAGSESSDPDGGGDDILLMKLQESDGKVVWKNQYGGASNENAYGMDVFGGYIYLTGEESSDPDGGNEDIFLMKVNESDGKVVWKNQYGGADFEKGYGVKASGGYIYVAGHEYSDSSGGIGDILVMKLQESDGRVVWKNQYGGANDDIGYDIEISGSHIFIAGRESSDPDGGDIDAVLMKINESDGTVVWKNQYGGSGWDHLQSLTISDNYLFAIGREESDLDGGQSDILVMKLSTNQPDSNIDEWSVEGPITSGWTLEGTTLNNEPINNWSLEGTTLNNEPINNWSLEGTTLNNEPINNWSLEGIALNNEPINNWSLEGISIDQEVWNAFTPEAPSSPYIIVPNEWAYEYGGASDDAGMAIAYSDGFIYASGFEESDADGGGLDIFLMKVNEADGTVVWKNQYGGSGDDNVKSIVVSANYVYCLVKESSDSDGGNNDFAILKVNQSNGSIVYKNQYGGTGDDTPQDIVLSGNYLYVAGDSDSDSDGASRAAVVMKINESDGTVVWKNQYGGGALPPPDEEVRAYGIAISGNSIYVTGFELADSDGGLADIFVMKLQESDGRVVWKNQYGGADTDVGYSIAVSGNNLYVTGFEKSDSSGGGEDVVVMKLNESNGQVVWKNQYGGTGGDRGWDIVESESYLYIVGNEASDSAGGQSDIFLMKLNESNGQVVWKNQYGGPQNDSFNFDISLIVKEDRIFVSGVEGSDPDGGGNDILIMKLNKNQSSSNITEWNLEGTTLDSEVIDEWSLEGTTLNTEVIDEWPLEGVTLNTEVIDEWSLEGTTLDDEAIDEWSLEGTTLNDEVIDNWSLEGTTLDNEVWDFFVPATPPAVFSEWAYEYGGTGQEMAFCIGNSNGYIFVAGIEKTDLDGGDWDIFVMKVDPATGVVQWKNQYGGAGEEMAEDIVFADGYVFVAGIEKTDSDGGDSDILLMKLNESDGTVAWKHQYGGISSELVRDMKISGNYIYIAGMDVSDTDGGNSDALVMKIDKNTGQVIWKNQYGGALADISNGLFLHGGYLYVTGSENSDSAGGGWDIFVMKLQESDGQVTWKKQYGGANTDSSDSIVVSGSYIYICGTESSDSDGGLEDILLMKLNESDGSVVWANQYGGAADNEISEGMVLDEGIIYLLAREETDPLGGDRDLAILKINSSDGRVLWKNQYGGPAMDWSEGILLYNDYLFVTGGESSDSDGGSDDVLIMSINTNQSGSNITGWPLEGTTLDAEIIDEWSVMGTDITGWSLEGTTLDTEVINEWSLEGTTLDAEIIDEWPLEGTTLDAEIIDEWSLEGITLDAEIWDSFTPTPSVTITQNEWAYEYGGAGDEYGEAMTISGRYLFITGYESSDSQGGDEDIFVMKVDESDGTVIWKNQYGGSGIDRGQEIIASGGYIYVGAREHSDPGGGYSDIALLKINESDGSIVYKHQYGGSAVEDIEGLAVEGIYIYVGGYESSDSDGGDQDMFIMKINEANGVVVWKYQYGGSDWEWLEKLTVSGDYIYATGRENSDPDGGSDDIFVMKIDKSDGKVIWKNQYGGSSDERPFNIKISGTYIYVTGFEKSDPDGGNEDIFVIKMNESDGKIVWKNQYGGSGNDGIEGLYIDGSHIYLAGYESSDSAGGSDDIVVMKLNESNGTVVWKNQYGGSGNDNGQDIIVADGRIFICGGEDSDSDGGGRDIVIIKLDTDQASSNITEWSLEGIAINNEAINSWNLEGTTLDREPIDGWILEGTSLDTEVINGWNLEGTSLDDEIIDNWSLEGTTLDDEVIDNWSLEGTTLDDETWDAYTPSVPSGPTVTPTEWAYEYGGADEDWAESIAYSDGYIYVAGREESGSGTGGGQADAFLMKIDESDGTVIWKNQYGGNLTEWGQEILVSGNYIYYLLNEQSDSDGGDRDIVVMKLNKSDGTVVWKYQYGGLAAEQPEAFGLSAGYLYVGGSEITDSDGGSEDLLLMKINESDGTVVWKNQYGGANGEERIKSLVFSDNYIYVTGSEKTDPDGGMTDLLVMKVQALDGAVVWKNQYGGPQGDSGECILKSGNYLYVGGVESSDSAGGLNDIALMKLQESDGTVVWKKQYGGSQNEVVEGLYLADGYLYLTGEEESDTDGGSTDIFVMKVNESNGNVVWKNQYGGSGIDSGQAIIVVDNRIFLCGEEASDPDGGQQDIFVIKMDVNQGSSNIDGWTVESGITNWSLEGTTLNGEIINNWSLEGTTLNNEPIDEWSLEGTTLDAESLDEWTAEGPITSGWSLEGTTLNSESLNWTLSP